ncbi:MAG: hypothetical protein NXI31_10050 [bacterium]|nr:hypothetical protein [bacterium]
MASILITAGPTREYLDDVRYLSNGSSGRMGCALAEAAMAAGHAVTLVLGPVAVQPPAGATVHAVTSAADMAAAAAAAFHAADIAIGAAAVSDYRPADRMAGKPPRGSGEATLRLVPNPDIIAGLGAAKAGRIVVGFALESTAAGMAAAIARGRRKLAQKHLDFVVVNLHDAIDAATSQAVLCFADGRDETLPHQDKAATAGRIVAAAVELHTRRPMPGPQG